jgi:hypothetical protein
MDRTWRYSIGAFLVGALPQTVKVFAMQGVPGTQFIVAIYLFAFLVPELFRVIVGPAGALEHYRFFRMRSNAGTSGPRFLITCSVSFLHTLLSVLRSFISCAGPLVKLLSAS